MIIQILPTTVDDIPAIFSIYDEAISYQKEVGNNHWFGFSREMVEKWIRDNRHLKLVADDMIICTFCFTLNDEFMWGKEASGVPAIYIHRIATGNVARGKNLVGKIIEWCREYAKNHHLEFLRIDTGSGNDRLINYYIKYGFTFLRDTKIDYTPDLPIHYKDGTFALLEMKA